MNILFFRLVRTVFREVEWKFSAFFISLMIVVNYDYYTPHEIDVIGEVGKL